MTPLNPRSFVVADAYPLERLGITSMLRQALGYEAWEAVEDLSGLNEAVARGVALAVVDRDLPGLERMDQLLALRCIHPRTRFVIVSGDCSLEMVCEALRCGAHGLVPKTLDAEEFAEAFRLVAEGGVYVPHEVCDLALGRPADVQPATHTHAFMRKLSERQKQVLALASEGYSNKEIARSLLISEATVKVHIGAAFRTMGVTNRLRAIAAFHGADPTGRAPAVLVASTS